MSYVLKPHFIWPEMMNFLSITLTCSFLDFDHVPGFEAGNVSKTPFPLFATWSQLILKSANPREGKTYTYSIHSTIMTVLDATMAPGAMSCQPNF